MRTEEGLLLTDIAAIAAYLEARYSGPPLMGRTPQVKAEIASWQWHVEFEGLMAVAVAFPNSSPAMVNRALPGPAHYSQISELGQRGLVRVQQFFMILNEQLAERNFIAAGQFSVADITAVVALDFARAIRLKPGEDLPHLVRRRAAMGRD